MSINHLIDQNTNPRYDIYCNDLNVEGDITNSGSITASQLNAENLYVSNDLKVDGSLKISTDLVLDAAVSLGIFLNQVPAVIDDGFVDISSNVFRSIAIKTETNDKIIREYVLSSTSAAVQLNKTIYRFNFKPLVVPFGTPGADVEVVNISFNVFNNLGASTCGYVDSSGNPPSGQKTIVSSVYTGTLPLEGELKTILIKITTIENKI